MAVSSPVTKRNPRPRKYASAAARQAAYRSRNEMLEFRAEPKTAETLTRIADTIDVSRSDLLLSMVKFALANHDWARFGLTHKTIPYYQGNPIMATKKPTAKQLEARARFAEMARSGAFKKKRTTKRKANPAQGRDAGEFKMTVNGKTVTRFFVHDSDPWANSYGFHYRLLSDVVDVAAPVKFTKTRAIVAVDEAADGSPVTETWEIRGLKFYQSNPRKKTVSQKISQLRHEGYPQKQAVAVALSEERAGKVKRNPMQGEQHLFGNKYATIRQDGDGRFVAQIYEKVKTGIGEEIDYWGSRYYKTHAGAQRYLDSLKPVRNNPSDLSVAQTILKQLGGNKFIAMTGAKEFVGGPEFLGFKIPKNMSSANRVTIKYFPARDLYEVDFIKSDRYGLNTKSVKTFDNVYAEQLRDIFTSVTGMETSLGTMGRKTNPQKRKVSAVVLMNPKVRTREVAKGVPESKVQYAVHLADRPSYHAIAYFTKKADAVASAQEASDRTGKQLAVSRVQVHFGQM